jgi:site-specific recombinase XerD
MGSQTSELDEGWSDALDGFENHLRASHRAEATVEAYMLHLRWLSDAAGSGPWELTRVEAGEWLDDHNWSQETRRKVLVSLRTFYAWAISARLAERSPLVGLGGVTAKRTGPQRTDATELWAEPIRQFTIMLQAGCRAAGTVRLRAFWLVNLSHHFADPWAVTSEDLSEYLSRPDWAPETKRSGRNAFRRFYGWAVRAGYIDIDPTAELPAVRIPRALPRPAPTDTIMEALQHVDDRLRLAMELCMFAGLRIGEVAQVRVADVYDDRIRVHGKGGTEREVPLHPDLRTSLRAELSRRDVAGVESPWLFPSRAGGHLTPGHLGLLIGSALGEGVTAHMLRHRFATRAYATTRDLRAVQELLGHARPETTARYAAVPDGALTAAVAGVGLL